MSARDLHGWAEISPAGPIEAGSTGTWLITYHAGERGIDDGGSIKFAWRDTSDWGTPQFAEPGAADFASVATTGAAELRAAYERQRYIRPWRRCVTVDVFDGWLRQGDTVTLTLGDTSGGSPGSRAQTFINDTFEFRVAVDWAGAWQYTVVPSPVVQVTGGRPYRVVAVGPSVTAPGSPGWLGVRVEDRWGNVCRDFAGRIELDADGLSGLPERYTFQSGDGGAHRFEGVRATAPGVHRVTVRADGLEAATVNPLVCRAAQGGPHSYWGDLHGQSNETVGTGPVSAHFTYARDVAFVDFAGHQGNDLQITDAVWTEIKRQANGHDEPGRYVAFVGWEWSGTTASGGDRNVYYTQPDGPLHRSSRVLVGDAPRADGADADAPHVRDLYAALRGHAAGPVIVPHMGGRRAELSWHDPELEPVIEVLSEWGEFEWFLRDALERGYQIGFVCGSDDHKGRPGTANPGRSTFGVNGGLACVFADKLSREGILSALRARRCYGTSGPRIHVEASADGHPVGAAFDADAAPQISVSVAGTAPVERIDCFRGTELLATFPERLPRVEDRVRVSWAGARNRDRQRMLRWDGSLSIAGGTFGAAEGWAFDSAAEGLEETSRDRITWRSVTTGDADGLLVNVEGPDTATLSFHSGVLQHRASLGEVRRQPVTVAGPGIDTRLAIEMAPTGSGLDVATTFRDGAAPPGRHAYWLRITQIDGAKAWLSPWYVTIE